MPAHHRQDQHVADLIALEQVFQRMLGTLTLAFQPIVRADDHAVFAYEALMRPNDPDLKHPGLVLDAAERLHRLPQLGRAIRSIAAQRFGPRDPGGGLLFLNIHALDLEDKSLSSKFAPLSKHAGRIVLEITERASLDGIADVRYRTAQLRELGFRIAIDDLGAGHDRMGTFDPNDTDFVKLDMSLVRDIDKHPMKQEFARAVAALCRDHDILVVGEGVETEAEAVTLRELGCDLLQGYFIARPGPDFPPPNR